MFQKAYRFYSQGLKMKYLVTGAAGFIGAATSQKLL
jgi:hypothetical protein